MADEFLRQKLKKHCERQRRYYQRRLRTNIPPLNLQLNAAVPDLTHESVLAINAEPIKDRPSIACQQLSDIDTASHGYSDDNGTSSFEIPLFELGTF